MFHSTRKSAWRRTALLIASAVLAMTMLAACGGDKGHSLEFKGVGDGEVVATYKGGQVTQAELDKYLSLFVLSQPAYESIVEVPEFKKALLEQYVSYKILGAQASEDSLKAARKQVDEQLQQFKDYKKQDETFAAEVKEKKITDEDMGTFLLLNAATIEHMNSKVTDEDITKSYETMKNDFTIVSARHILVATSETDPTTQESKELRTLEEALARAKEAKAKLDAGGDWTELAKQYSDDGGSKENGGLYENATAGQWVEAFKKAAIEQEVGVIGEPVETEYGYHVIKVEKREEKTYDQLSDDQKEQVKSAAAYTYMETFMTEEMPKQELNITLPEPETEEGEAGTEGDAGTEGESNAGAAEGDASGNTAASDEKKE
ncbi:peptidylprolyl isomerase [Paenibacillus soyae]|uniref:Peptidylprolyl isomerase n=1 Tax=Paenibacillus soyae TaxID=2969249 RepID=A0A9X2SDK2_9BACL|nr:peptidylprolyl isomerase [Paenibacillus soyae]MCR2807202.1 peptidylprolyl isomerase [Paenibacillus soyae]